MKLGGEALAGTPVRSASFQEEPMKRLLNHPRVFHSIGHGCHFGIAHVNSGELLLKPTMWISTSPEICDELGLKCKNMTNPGDHIHDLCLGGSRITQHAGRYTKQIAEAIHRGFVKTLKRKEPGRIRQMLRWVSTRIRKDGHTAQLRWSEKSLKKAIDQWSAVFVNESPNVQDPPELQQSIAASEPDGAPDDPMMGDGRELHPEGITFQVPAGRKLSEPIGIAACAL